MCVCVCVCARIYTLDRTKSEWADYAVQAWSGNLPGTNQLTRNSSGKPRPQSFQLADPLLTDSGLKCGISVRELIPTWKISASEE